MPRTALFVPRWAFWLATQPVRLGAWSYEHYHLSGRWRSGVAGREKVYGITPTARFESTFGFAIGARFYHRDLMGQNERFRLSASTGGHLEQGYQAQLHSGDRFGPRLGVELKWLYEERGRERFYGIGNGDATATPPGMLIDPLTDSTAVETRFEEDLIGTALVADTPLAGKALVLRGTGVLMLRDFDGVDHDRSIERFYDTMRLPGFAAGTENLYGELELRYDTRRPVSDFQSQAIDATGWLATAHLGVMTGINHDNSQFVRYGGEVQKFFDLYRGSRILALRVMVDTVAGDEISFIDLPRLGGSDHLRGYTQDRFRDRAATLASAEYTWELGNFLAAYTFVDTGRVFPSLRDFAFRDFRLGYGGGVQLHLKDDFLMRAQVAASREGDVMLDIAFSPTFGRRERAWRP